ncbi:hypothetical protein GCM10027346_13960 [Hymenobacter seoulensis]
MGKIHGALEKAQLPVGFRTTGFLASHKKADDLYGHRLFWVEKEQGPSGCCSWAPRG